MSGLIGLALVQLTIAWLAHPTLSQPVDVNIHEEEPGEPMRHSSNNASVKVKVLGTAQDAGLPQLGCRRAHCQAAWKNPDKVRLVSSLAVVDCSEQKVFLIDATPDVRPQIQMIQTDKDLSERKAFNPVDGVFLTHAHMGHYAGLLHFGFESISTKEMSVYCTERMAHFLKRNGPWSQLVSMKNISLNPIKYEESIRLTERVSIAAMKVPHRDEFSDTVGYLVRGPSKRLLFIPDIDHWNKWERTLEDVLETVDYAFLDGSFFSPAELPNRDLSKIKHPLITQTVSLLEDFLKRHATKVYFTHLNHTNLLLNEDGEKLKWLESKGFFLAEDGMELEL